MIEQVVEKWHLHLKGSLPGGLDALLDDDVVFYSPIVFTPQRGKDVTALYLTAASSVFPGEGPVSETGEAKSTGDGFHYTKETFGGNSAVLEFETTMEGKYVNGVDMITCNDAGKIIEFRVMIRPLQAVNLVHEQMGRMLDQLKA
jgi:hypothetical protein